MESHVTAEKIVLWGRSTRSLVFCTQGLCVHAFMYLCPTYIRPPTSCRMMLLKTWLRRTSSWRRSMIQQSVNVPLWKNNFDLCRKGFVCAYISTYMTLYASSFSCIYVILYVCVSCNVLYYVTMYSPRLRMLVGTYFFKKLVRSLKFTNLSAH